MYNDNNIEGTELIDMLYVMIMWWSCDLQDDAATVTDEASSSKK